MASDQTEELTRALSDAVWRSCAGRPADTVMQALARVTAIVVSVGCDSQLEAKSELVSQFFRTKYLALDNWDKFEEERSARRQAGG